MVLKIRRALQGKEVSLKEGRASGYCAMRNVD